MKGIIIFGDSIVFGRGERPSKGWVGRLKNDYEIKDPYNAVYNLGIPGNTTENLLYRIETELKARALRIREGDYFHTIIAIGLNDTKRINGKIITEKNKFQKNIEKIKKIAEKYSDKVTFIGLTKVDDTRAYEGTIFDNKTIEEYDEIIKNTANNYIEVFSVLNLADFSDDVHPNKLGYDRLYQKIRKTILE